MPSRTYVALDLETTGLEANRDAIIEVGAVRFKDGRIQERFVTFVNPRRLISARITQITGIRDADVAAAPSIEQVLPELEAFVSSDVAAVVCHNAAFDISFLRAQGLNFHRPALDTLELAAILLPGQPSYSLGELCHTLSIPLVEAHRALDDAEATANLFIALTERLRQLDSVTLSAIYEAADGSGWSATDLFGGALAEKGAWLAFPSEHALLPNVAFPNSPPLRDENAEPTHPIDIAQMEALFAPDGSLARLMGSEYEMRAGQTEMAARIGDAFNKGEHLMVEAGTGTGKTLAYLVPSALWATRNQQRVVIATNTIALQDQLLDKDIPQVEAVLAAEHLAPARTAVLKGRSNYLCLRRFHQWRLSHHGARGMSPAEVSMLARILVWLPTTRTGDVNELAINSASDRELWAELCSDSDSCSDALCGPDSGPHHLDFYLLAHRRAEAAHMVVVNHALLLADFTTEGRVLPQYSHLVIDEAHRLEEAATDQLTVRIDPATVVFMLNRFAAGGDLNRELQRWVLLEPLAEGRDALLRAAAHAEDAVHQIRSFHSHLLTFGQQHFDSRESWGVQRLALDGSARSQPMWSEVEIIWEQAAQELQLFTDALGALIQSEHSMGWLPDDPAAKTLTTVSNEFDHFSALIKEMEQMIFLPHGMAQGRRVAWLEISESRAQAMLASAPLHVSDVIQEEILHRRRSAIFTGATLRSGANFRFIRERLGLWDVSTAIVDSPFDYQASALVFMPSDIQQPTHPNYQPGVERAILDAAEAANGRTLVLFTSMAHLRATADAIRAPLERIGITLYQQGNGSRHRLLREYRASERAVLLGTRSFWEGIDLPGDQLSCLLIARLPFAVPSDPLVGARSAECDDPFNDYTLPDAVLRFRQGFGRLIRRATDRGVVVLLDSRVWRKEYGHLFLDALPPCTVRHAPLSLLGGEVRRWLAT